MPPTAVTRTVAGVTITSDVLPPVLALELAPEVAIVVTPVIGELFEVVRRGVDLERLSPSLLAVSRELLGGRLRTLTLPLLSNTFVTYSEDGVKHKVDTLNEETQFNQAFAGERLSAILPTIFLAAEVTFGRFFGVKDLVTLVKLLKEKVKEGEVKAAS